MERQPRTSLVELGSVISVQVRAPTKSWPLAPRARRLWYPSVMTIPELVTAMLVRSTTVSSPHVGAAVVWPVQACEGTPPEYGVPARYMVVPFTRATLPAHCGVGSEVQTAT